MLQKSNQIPIKAPFLPPAPPSGSVLPLTNALTHFLDSTRKICLQKELQKLRKCKNRVPIKVPFYPNICPPGPPPTPPSKFFWSLSKAWTYV